MADKFKVYRTDFADRKVMAVSAFKGVDWRASQLDVADCNATSMVNLVHKDGVIQTRLGFETVAQCSARINGLWKFVAEDGAFHVVAHVGTHLYEVKRLGSSYSFLKPTFIAIDDTVVLEDYRSQAFVGANRLYVLGGTKYLMVRISGNSRTLKEVEDADETYVPVTTIGITYADSPVSGSSALDDVNMMTQWRKNKLVSGTYVDDGVTVRTTRFWDWTLDTSVKPKEATDLNDMEVVVSQLRAVS